MKLTPQQTATLNKWLMIAGVLTAILGPLFEYLSSGSVINSAGILAALGAGLAAYAKKAPGHFTPEQADRMAHDRASDAVAKAVLPPLADLE